MSSELLVETVVESVENDASRVLYDAQTIAASILHLAHRRDVLVVAVPLTLAVKLAKRVVALARALHLPCRNLRDCDDERAPVVRVRTLNTPLPVPTPRQGVVYDRSAMHDRGSVREAAVRSVVV